MDDSRPAPSAFWQAVRANHRLQQQAPAIKPVERNGPIPLTFGQERLWLVEQIQPGTPAHNLRAIFRLQGRLDLAALQKSLQAIVQRHEIVRTSFPVLDGRPVQLIAPELPLDLPLVDLQQLRRPEQEAEVQRLAAAEAQQAFDLAAGPLVRLKLLRLAADETILLRSVHHLINDRWSDSIFMSELAALYQAFANGQPAPLPALPIQYADVALFQRQWLQGEVLQAHLDYWRQQLAGQPEPVRLPVDTGSTAAPSYAGNAHYLTLAPELVAALKQLAQQEGVSLFVVLLAAFKTLLYRYSGQEELILCSPVAGRHRVETRKLIGYFANLVLLRTSLQGNPTFRELISRVSQVTLGAFAHQDLPLQQLAETLNIPGAILSRVMFALQNVPAYPAAMADITITPLHMPEGIANFDLSLSLKPLDAGLLAILRYKTDLFEEATASRMLAHFQELLQLLVANPELHLAELPRYAEEREAGNVSTLPEPGYVAPRSELEQTIAGIWQTILRRDRLSVEANFFALGGGSLDLVQVGLKLQELLGQDVMVRELFKHPTIRGMAHYLSQQRSEKQPADPLLHERTRKQQAAVQRQKQLQKQRRNPNE